jgi:hypothetical protein
MRIVAVRAVGLFACVGACAGASGYDASRYEKSSTPASSASAEPDTAPIPVPSRRSRLVDPRSPLDASAP